MEGLAWLLIKMGTLLALTGTAFFALGWWLRSRRRVPSTDTPLHDIEHVKSALHASETRADTLDGEIMSLRARLVAADEEVRALRTAPPSADLPEPFTDLLPTPAAKMAKSKVPRKPRAKKSKA